MPPRAAVRRRRQQRIVQEDSDSEGDGGGVRPGAVPVSETAGAAAESLVLSDLEADANQDADNGDGDGDEEAEEQASLDTDAGEAVVVPKTPSQPSKRKRETMPSPATASEQAELARRRRRRQSLVFQQRRKSLTPSKGPGSGASGGAAADKPSRQYISDMYSTIIKMSSENKINVKNSWSLHLIDHMEDILSSPNKERRSSAVGADEGTYNFQKASCTLDASIKIYSYRVDDTWTSSYKILENLSRTGNKRDVDGIDDDEDEGENDEDGEGSAESKKKSAKKSRPAGKTIEKNLSNITLKNYEIAFEPDPMFHKMSQAFDEGGTKGLLLANLGVYDGAKILLNSADVQFSTLKPVKEANENKDPDDTTEPVSSEAPKFKTTFDMSTLAPLPLPKEVLSLEICPRIRRLYDQIDEYRGSDFKSSKVKITNRLLDDYDQYKTLNAPSQPCESTGQEEDEATEERDEMTEVEEEPVSAADVSDDDCMEASFEDTTDDMDVDPEDSIAENATVAAPDNEHDPNPDDAIVERTIDPVVVGSAPDLKLPTITSAADYFKSQESSQHAEDEAYSQLIETALMKSVSNTLDGNSMNVDDYSYFDAKLLKNWAGPSHLKIKPSRKPVMIILNDEEETENGKMSTVARRQKKTSAGPEKRSAIVDFLSTDVPKLDCLKPPRAASSIVLSKLVISRQMHKSSELVFPVDAHIHPQQFFSHFMKPRLSLFHRRVRHGAMQDLMITGEDLSLPPVEIPPSGYGVNDADEGFDHFSDGGSDAEQVLEDEYSTQGLLAAERIVKKVDIHYERVAKRVDVKKLKSTIWSHLESKTGLLPSIDAHDDETKSDNNNPDRQRQEEKTATAVTFDGVIQGVADEVPSNVTVSFYFICMLHLANEKGLRLEGQDDLSNFKIKKEESQHP